MRKSDVTIPAELRNGAGTPEGFGQIQERLGQAARYKIVAYSIDAYATWWRLVHLYLISVVSTDPSNIRKFMDARGATATAGFDDHGHAIRDLVVYSQRIYLAKMPEFGGMIKNVIEENKTSYLMETGYSLVQYSSDRFREPVVITTISRR